MASPSTAQGAGGHAVRQASTPRRNHPTALMVDHLARRCCSQRAAEGECLLANLLVRLAEACRLVPILGPSNLPYRVPARMSPQPFHQQWFAYSRAWLRDVHSLRCCSMRAGEIQK